LHSPAKSGTLVLPSQQQHVRRLKRFTNNLTEGDADGRARQPTVP